MVDDTGEIFTFATTSRGGINGIAELARHYGRNRHKHPDDFPIIALEVETYQHSNPQFGRIKVPEFKRVGWRPKADFYRAIGEAPETAVKADNLSDEIPF